MRVNVTDSLYVKFLSRVDDNGQPYKGRIIYSDGISAEVNLDRKRFPTPTETCTAVRSITCSKRRGEMRYANGDTYKGRTKNDLIDATEHIPTSAGTHYR